MSDVPGPVATGRDSIYSISIDEAVELYVRAGHARTPRTVQRYCGSGHLDCVKETTTLGDKYFINPDSVMRHIAQIEELIALDNRTSGRDLSRQAATIVAPENQDRAHASHSADVSQSVAPGPENAPQSVADSTRQSTTADASLSRPVATGEADGSRYVAQLEKRIDEKDQFISLLTTQLNAKDQQITELSARYRETNTLAGAMQRMLAPLLGQADPYTSAPDKREASEKPPVG